MLTPPSDHDDCRDGPGRPRYWRSIAEWSEGRALDTLDEFPDRSLPDDPTRREFIRLAGASLSLAGLVGCGLKQPPEKIVPYVEMPEHLIPGKPLYFATATERSGLGLGLVAESHEGRPTKLEGNPDHPSSDGATDVFAQAEVLSLYDPDRSRIVLARDEPGGLSTLNAFQQALTTYVNAARRRQGDGLRLLAPAYTSPTIARLISELMEQLPQAQWHLWEPCLTFAEEQGVQQAFGRRLKPVYRFDQADVVLSLDADILAAREFPPIYARDLMSRRRLFSQKSGNRYAMSRLYAVDCVPTLTGAKADHRLPTVPEGVYSAAVSIAKELGLRVDEDTASAETDDKWLKAVAADLRRAVDDGGKAVVVAGPHQPAEVHALAQRINERLGAIGSVVRFIESPVASPDAANADVSLRQLVQDMRRGRVETLIVLDVDPVRDGPPDLGFGNALEKVPQSVHLGIYENDTSRRTSWHVPRSHFLETWGDVRGHDGTVAITQPLIEPLYQSLSPLELVGLLAGRTQSAYDLVRETLARSLASDFENEWHRLLQRGVLRESLSEAVEVSSSAPRDPGERSVTSPGAKETDDETGRFQLAFRPDPTLWDGRYANNGWLQELPRSLTKLTWGNAALLSPTDAKSLRVEDGDVVRIRRGEAMIELPVLRLPLQPRGCITLYLGHGRGEMGRVAAGAVGADVNLLRTSASLWSARGASVTPTGKRIELAATQSHFSMEGEHLVRGGTLTELNSESKQPGFAHPHKRQNDATLYREWEYNDRKWGMAIDLTTCTGCGACVIACQAENNIPVVGRTEVLRKREMHWIRIDTYYEGSPEMPGRVVQQPVPCMHCELAPCEPVCPVAATVHSGTGLNQMVYNRCIGTRYCSNNCPYKVRRFNFLAYSDRFHTEPVLELLPNPDVTIRSRGVMEKCTYCVQRIEEATITAKVEKRPLRDGEIVTACQQVCPTEAILFGDINDSTSAVTQAKASPLDYALLEELNTRPRTTYLAEVHNLNHELQERTSESMSKNTSFDKAVDREAAFARTEST